MSTAMKSQDPCWDTPWWTGVDNMLWGNDFPHAESTWPKSREFLDRIFAGVPAEDRSRITSENASVLFRFERS